MRALGLIVACAVLAAGPAGYAATTSGTGTPDMVATASTGVSAPSDPTAAQITDWLNEDDSRTGQSPGQNTGQNMGQSPALGPDRGIHGEVGAAVGSHGYREGFATATMPIGEDGRLGVAIDDAQYDGRHGYGGGERRSLAVSLRLGKPDARSDCERHTYRLALPTDDDKERSRCAAGTEQTP